MATMTVTVHSTVEAISCEECSQLHNVKVFSKCLICHYLMCMHSDCSCPLTPLEEAELALG
jgi:hypothetical protein